MKKFRILGIVAILVIVLEFILSITASWKDASDSFMEGFNSTQRKEHALSYRSVAVSVRPLETTRLDSLTNSLTKENIPYKIVKVDVPIHPSIWSNIIIIFGGVSVFAILGGIYCLIRLLIAISKRDVFSNTNVIRIRVFTYSLVFFQFLNSLLEWLDYLEVTKQIALKGYEIKGFHLSADWTLLVIMILFTEIFAVGVKIEEEQELTI